MQPGLNRAIPLGLLGFLLGAFVTILLRSLQGIEPVWNTGVGLSLAAFTTAFFFIWGMGAFNPKMSAHGGEEEAVEEVVEPAPVEDATPSRILFGSTWQLATILLIFLVVLFGFATLPGGLTLQTTADPGASLTEAGIVDVNILNLIFIPGVSQFVIFAVVIILIFLSLVAFAAILYWLVTGADRGIRTARLEAAAATAGAGGAPTGSVVVEPEPNAQPAGTAGSPLVRTLRRWVPLVVLFIVLYLFFYYVAIGLILPTPDLPGLNILFPAPQTQLVVLSAVNAAIFTLLILRTNEVLRFIGRAARWVLGLVRRSPNLLQR